MKLNQKQLAWWRRTRRNGKLRFVLVRGVLGWGLLLAVFWSVVTHLLSHGANGFMSQDFYQRLLIALALFPVGGLSLFLWLWFQLERAYSEQQDEDALNAS
jgi:hypothetical protein